MRVTQTTFRAVLLCSCLGMTGTAFAQRADQQASEPSRLDEIVVTAQRTSENLQSVPVAVTAFDAGKLERQGITNVQNLQFHTPNVSIREEASIGGLSIGIRGINVSVDNFAFDSAVGVYENGVFIARGHSFNSSFYDLANVQVLRGPQGTLFGRDTPVGAILIDTAKVSKEYEGYLKVTVGGGGNGIGKGADRGLYRVEGAINLPISEQFGVRIAGYGLSDDGWARSRVTGYRWSEKHDFGLRTTFHFAPSESVDANLVLAYSHQAGGMPMFTPIDFSPGTTLLAYDQRVGGRAATDATIALAAHYNPYENESMFKNERLRKKAYSAALNVDFNLSDNVSLKSITGLRGIRNFQVNDLVAVNFPTSSTTDTTHQDQFSQEFILNVDLSDSLHLLTGVNYFHEWGFEENIVQYVTVRLSPTVAFNNPLSLGGRDIKYTSKSVFGNVSFDVTPEFKISAGGRFAKEDKALTIDTRFLAPLNTQTASGRFKFSDNIFVYDVKAQWKPNSDILLYAKYGTGYRAGGVGFRGPDSAFKPEHSKTAEVGTKFDFNLGEAPARLNVALFHTKYSDFQISVTDAGPPVRTIVRNAGGARINGAEVEFSIKPVRNLDISANLGLIDAKYTSFIVNDISLGGLVDFTNNKLRYAPATTFALSVAYTIETGSGNLIPSVDWSHQSTYFVDTEYQPTAPLVARTNIFRQGPTNIVNARLTLEKAFGSNVDISIWGKNLTDQTVLAYGLSVGRLKTGVFAEPLSYGLDVRMAF